MKNIEVEILLIEDNPNDAELTIRSFKKNNITNNVLHLKDGSAALEFLFGSGQFEGRNLDNRPKLILLDLKMPKVDGIEVLQKIKANDSTKTIPVVVLTSSNQDPDIEKCYELGANSYIVKPVDFDAFQKVVTQLGLYWMLLNQPPGQLF